MEITFMRSQSQCGNRDVSLHQWIERSSSSLHKEKQNLLPSIKNQPQKHKIVTLSSGEKLKKKSREMIRNYNYPGTLIGR